jgi:glycosyltransferase involved in cell wall biosynthesis
VRERFAVTRGLPSLLFVAPILPADGGNGLAMRAGAFLDALARDFDVTLLVIPVAGDVGTVTPFVRRRTRRVVTLSLAGALDPLWELCMRLRDPEARAAAVAAYPRPALCRYATTPCLDAARTAIAGARFDVVHVTRSYLAPYAAPFLSAGLNAGPTFTSVDIDDDEVLTHRRLAAMFERMGRGGEARVEVAEASKYERLEAECLPRFRLRSTSNPTHAEEAATADPDGNIVVIPNTVALPRIAPRWRRSRKRILFVGNLSYWPNIDGICTFVDATLPLLRSLLAEDVKVRIVGSTPAPEVVELAGRPGVELVADPPHLASHYRWADLCVVPLTAGGGTRIKVLEAFAYSVPVVSTRLGAEGIAARDRVHLLLADSHEAFAGACAEMLSDVPLARALAQNARRLIETNHSHVIGERIIRETFAGVVI